MCFNHFIGHVQCQFSQWKWKCSKAKSGTSDANKGQAFGIVIGFEDQIEEKGKLNRRSLCFHYQTTRGLFVKILNYWNNILGIRDKSNGTNIFQFFFNCWSLLMQDKFLPGTNVTPIHAHIGISEWWYRCK